MLRLMWIRKMTRRSRCRFQSSGMSSLKFFLLIVKFQDIFLRLLVVSSASFTIPVGGLWHHNIYINEILFLGPGQQNVDVLLSDHLQLWNLGTKTPTTPLDTTFLDLKMFWLLFNVLWTIVFVPFECCLYLIALCFICLL